LLPALHADGVGWSDWAGGIGLPVEGVCVPLCPLSPLRLLRSSRGRT
jgi:hypothetical protein